MWCFEIHVWKNGNDKIQRSRKRGKRKRGNEENEVSKKEMKKKVERNSLREWEDLHEENLFDLSMVLGKSANVILAAHLRQVPEGE